METFLIRICSPVLLASLRNGDLKLQNNLHLVSMHQWKCQQYDFLWKCLKDNGATVPNLTSPCIMKFNSINTKKSYKNICSSLSYLINMYDTLDYFLLEACWYFIKRKHNLFFCHFMCHIKLNFCYYGW